MTPYNRDPENWSNWTVNLFSIYLLNDSNLSIIVIKYTIICRKLSLLNGEDY